MMMNRGHEDHALLSQNKDVARAGIDCQESYTYLGDG